MPLAKLFSVLFLCLCLGACFNDNNERSVHLGNATIGQQLMDLKAAREAEAISKSEYHRARADLLRLLTHNGCDDDDCEDAPIPQDPGGEENEEDEGFSWL